MELHIPEGINYECTGCGTCCGGWAVPLTDDDFDRIARKDWASLNKKFTGKSIFRGLKQYEMEGQPYTHAIKEGEDGHCPFLVDKLCFIHSQFGAKAKPSICQLYPYCFNETPSGVYATVKFDSMGVIYNSGKALTRQKALLESKWREFQALYPNHHPNWSNIQMTVGKPVSWDQYLKHENRMLMLLKDRKSTFASRLLKVSDYLISTLNRPVPGAGSSLPEAFCLKKLDRHLLAALQRIYLPVAKLGRGEGDFNLFRFLYQLAFLPARVEFPGLSFPFEQLYEFAWPAADKEIDDLIFRYFYTRIYGKYYFGAGFGQLSIITGFHHLILIYALICLKSKSSAISRQAPVVSLLDVIATIRQLEKRLGETALGGWGAGAWELLMFSPQRVRRVLASI